MAVEGVWNSSVEVLGHLDFGTRGNGGRRQLRVPVAAARDRAEAGGAEGDLRSGGWRGRETAPHRADCATAWHLFSMDPRNWVPGAKSSCPGFPQRVPGHEDLAPGTHLIGAYDGSWRGTEGDLRSGGWRGRETAPHRASAGGVVGRPRHNARTATQRADSSTTRGGGRAFQRPWWRSLEQRSPDNCQNWVVRIKHRRFAAGWDEGFPEKSCARND